MKSKTYYVYMLECRNGNFYTGYTTDFERRWQEHQQGSPKCKYTRSFPPKHVCLCLIMEDSLSVALKLEKRIKKLSRKQKIILINNKENLRAWLNSQEFSDVKDITEVFKLKYT